MNIFRIFISIVVYILIWNSIWHNFMINLFISYVICMYTIGQWKSIKCMIHVYGSITCILHIIIVIIKPVIRHSYIKLTGVVHFTSQINTYDLPTLVINWQAIKCQWCKKNNCLGRKGTLPLICLITLNFMVYIYQKFNTF